MDEEKKIRLWLHYSSIWRSVLTHVLEWSTERVEQYIEELRQEMEGGAHDPAGYGFFFDPPSHYLWRPILGNLYERTGGNEANPHSIYQRLENAISGGLNHWEMDEEGFDWNRARQRYQTERRRIEQWLANVD
jgi:hypothetical protein